MRTTFSKDANGVAFVMFQAEVPIEAYEFTAFAKQGIEKGVELKVNKQGDRENVVLLIKGTAQAPPAPPKKEDENKDKKTPPEKPASEGGPNPEKK